MERIILDTNFLLIPIQLHVDIYAELERIIDGKYELYALEKSLAELVAITHKKGRQKEEAKIALQLAKAKNIKIKAYDSEKYVDDCLTELANEGFIIATQDKALRDKLREQHHKVIVLRQKQYLTII